MKNSIKIVFLIFSIIFVCFFVYSCYVIFPLDIFHSDRKVLLQETDFPELLKAGRELISRAEWKVYTAGSGQRVRDLVIPEDVNIPEIITELIQKFPDLSRTAGMNDTGYFRISFAERELGLWGVYIYPDDFKKPEGDYYYGDKMIMPGLWYYDSWYDELGPKYDKKIDRRIKKNKFLQ